ncbi:hypothetical protein GMD88_10740 [Pseudoflavonifractor sp. BIOML-A6]|nr:MULTISPECIES: hypothetical protein [unclassified Pseudoflavonifractor]MTQ97478.1 hypothetical protein [Pseudoflavonifractor sp. BIOML-A16]MTR06560.1 hypothetical protein [Pseudoflavonifractor sp. BIOML-A15]MTR31941.1 hypothetical protein [Pseudoflavonifractor sp. BIOML-A14]MTR74071.1 hypothetical protein [Pseudoflavonifractor sp. BIOML-A18]MTS64492.1 hypothetical protein [Pseudoflavonifractor sp. BIOML-A5]MTS72674.1 hypothetical protein [Pseudoflavonifractor sp. BIOML-A8]MTS90220.1 hypoth
MNEFLSGVLSLFSNTLGAMMTQPILVFFLAALLLGVVFSLVLLLSHGVKKM